MATKLMTRITGPATQSFREERSSRTFTIDALYDKKTGQHVIRWTDVLQVCKGASYVSSNGKLVPFLTDEDLENLIPLRIAYQQDTIFDVVFAATAHIMDISSYNTTAVDGTAHIQATTHQISNLSIASDDPSKALVLLGSDTADLTPRAQVSFMAYSQLYKSFLAAVKAGQQTQVVEIKSAMDVHFDRLQQEMDRNHNLLVQLRDLQQKIDDQQQEMLNMQRQTLNHLAVIQNRLQAIFNQNYELHEYPIPRLFIVLPKPQRRRDLMTGLMAQQFRLFFLCECGTHTMSETSTIKHEIHMAKHEGYDITHPTEFFQKYGPRVLKVLQWLRYGVAVAGVVAPGLGHLGLAGGIDQLQKALGSTIKDLKPLMDKAIQFLEGQMNSSGSDLELTPDQAEIEKLEVLEGADLRQLESFLKVTDQARSLANLYRIVTHEGHVKWVCIDHYRANYQESAVKQLQEFIEAHNGEFSEEEGKIKVRVGSRSAAKQFYGALVKAPRIQELDIQLGWDATLDDFRKFKDAVSNANIVHLVIGDFPFDGPVLDAINSSRRFSPLVELMSNMRIQSVEFRYLKNMEARISSSSFATSSRLRILIISSLISVALFSRIIQNCTSLVELKIQMSPLRDAIQEVTRRASSLSNIKSVCISNKSALVEFSLHQGCITNIRLSDRDKQFLDFIDTLPVDQFDSLELNSIIVQDLKCLVEILRASTRLSNLSLSCTAATSLPTIELVKEIRVAGQSTGVIYEPLILRFHNPDAWDQSDGFMVTVKPSGTSGIADGIFVSIQMFSSSRYASRNPWFWGKIFQQYGSQIHEIHRDFKLSDEYASLFDEATNRDGCNLMSLHMDMSELSISGMERMSRVIARCRPESFHRLDFTFDDLQSERQDMAMRLLSKHGILIHKLTIRSSSLKRLIPELQKLHLTKHDLPALEDFFLFDNLRDSSMIFSKSSVEWLCSMISVPVLSPVLTVLDPEASTTVPLIRYDIKPLRSFSLSNIRMQTRAWDILLSSLDFLTLETLRLLLCDLEIAVLERMVDCIPENDDIEVPLRELEISYSHFEPSSKFKEVAEKLKRKAPLVHIVYQHQKIY